MRSKNLKDSPQDGSHKNIDDNFDSDFADFYEEEDISPHPKEVLNTGQQSVPKVKTTPVEPKVQRKVQQNVKKKVEPSNRQQSASSTSGQPKTIQNTNNAVNPNSRQGVTRQVTKQTPKRTQGSQQVTNGVQNRQQVKNVNSRAVSTQVNTTQPVQQTVKKRGIFSRKTKEKKIKVKKPMTVGKAVFLTIISMSLVFGVGSGFYYYTTVYVPPAIAIDYSSSGQKPLGVLEKSLREYNISELNNQLVSKDSWILKEVDYANGVKSREDFIQKILSKVKFEYPTMQAYNKRGLMFNKMGEPILVPSDMTHGEKVTVTHIDYNALANKFQENKDEILKLVASHGYKKTDYLYKDEMIDTMIEYINTIKDLPLKSDEVKIQLENNPIITTDEKGKEISKDNYSVVDDVELDRLLFSSDEFHRMCDSFAMVISGWTPKIEQQQQDNPEYAKYQRDIASGAISANVPAPEKKIMVNVVTGDSFPPEEVVPYTWIGSYYLQHEYQGGKKVILPQLGNGTFEKPAGKGTVLVVKAIDTSGYAHDVRITFNNMWRDQEAIDYLAKFSEQNRGISNSASVKMLCAEFTIQNLDKDTITLNEDMALSDKAGNLSSKTGTIYGLTESITLAPNESKSIQAWTSSTELDRKYLVWGRSYNKQYPIVWFKELSYNKADDKDKDKGKSTDSKDNTDSKSDDNKEEDKADSTK